MASKSAGKRRSSGALIILACCFGLPLAIGVASCVYPIQFGNQHGIYLGQFGGRRRRYYRIEDDCSGGKLILLTLPPGVSVHRATLDGPCGDDVRICVGGIGPGWELTIW